MVNCGQRRQSTTPTAQAVTLGGLAVTQTRTVAQVFCACAIGAGIGGLIGSIGGVAWAIVGLVIGGLLAYLAYDPAMVRAACKQAAAETWPKVAPSFEKELVKRRLKTAGLYILAATPSLTFVAIFFATCASGFHGLGAQIGYSLLIGLTAFADLMMISVGLAKISVAVIRWRVPDHYPAPQSWVSSPQTLWKMMIRHGNVLAMAFWAAVFGLAVIVGVARLLGLLFYQLVFVPAVIAEFGRFVLRVLRLIHSDGRLLCGCDALLGIAIGLKLGGPSIQVALASALIGGLLGAANYHWVAPRLLAYQPVRTRN